VGHGDRALPCDSKGLSVALGIFSVVLGVFSVVLGSSYGVGGLPVVLGVFLLCIKGFGMNFELQN